MCCEDHLHCCPHGTICNLVASTCDDPTGTAVVPWLDKVPALPSLTDNSKCDQSASCPGKSTCCKTTSGDWACCPLPQVRGNSNHNCPILKQRKQRTDIGFSVWVFNRAAKLHDGSKNVLVTLDDPVSVLCASQAVCCDDHIHCCPHGTVCNLEAETCDSLSGFSASLPWVSKVPALTSRLQDEACDQQTLCPGGTTCCKRNSGQWTCCPLPQVSLRAFCTYVLVRRRWCVLKHRLLRVCLFLCPVSCNRAKSMIGYFRRLWLLQEKSQLIYWVTLFGDLKLTLQKSPGPFATSVIV